MSSGEFLDFDGSKTVGFVECPADKRRGCVNLISHFFTFFYAFTRVWTPSVEMHDNWQEFVLFHNGNVNCYIIFLS